MSEDDRIAALEKRVAELEEKLAEYGPELTEADLVRLQEQSRAAGPIFALDDESYRNVTIRRVATMDEPWADVDRPGT